MLDSERKTTTFEFLKYDDCLFPFKRTQSDQTYSTIRYSPIFNWLAWLRLNAQAKKLPRGLDLAEAGHELCCAASFALERNVSPGYYVFVCLQNVTFQHMIASDGHPLLRMLLHILQHCNRFYSRRRYTGVNNIDHVVPTLAHPHAFDRCRLVMVPINI